MGKLDNGNYVEGSKLFTLQKLHQSTCSCRTHRRTKLTISDSRNSPTETRNMFTLIFSGFTVEE